MKKRLNPTSAAMVDAIADRIRRMTPEQALAFLTYRTPGVEETDMTGMNANTTKRPPRLKRRKTAAKAAAA